MLAGTRAGWLLGSATIAATTLTATSSGFAQTDSGTMTVQAQVVQTCTMGTVGVLDFGNLTPGEDKNAQANFVVDCNIPGEVTVALDNGQNHDGTRRRMARDGGGSIAYNLYRGTPTTDPWNGPFDYPVSEGETTITVHGRTVSAVSGSIPAGDYSDSVTITVTF